MFILSIGRDLSRLGHNAEECPGNLRWHWYVKSARTQDSWYTAPWEGEKVNQKYNLEISVT